MNISYCKPTLLDIPKMAKIVQEEVRLGIILNRTNDEIATNIRSYFLAKVDKEIVGFCALHIHSPKLAEIRSLVIAKEYRKKHFGVGLVKNALDEARGLKVPQVLVLTYSQEFFEKLGFKEISKDLIPEQKIWADCIKCKHFPVCNEISLIIHL